MGLQQHYAGIQVQLRVVLLLAAMLVLLSCSSLVLKPSAHWIETPAQYELAYEDIRFQSLDGVELSAWLIAAKQPERLGAIIYFHGNAANISAHLKQVYWLANAGYDVFMVDYRGFGQSAGKHNVKGAYSDEIAAYRWFIGRYQQQDLPLISFGQSFGAASSSYVLASNAALKKFFSLIIIDSAFTDYQSITRDILSRNWLSWSLQYPIAAVMPRGLNLIDVVEKLAPTPTLFIHSKDDELIQFSHGVSLYARAKQPKSFWSVSGPHISAFYQLENRQLLLAYLDQLLGLGQQVDDQIFRF